MPDLPGRRGVGDEKEPRAATPPGERMSREAPVSGNDRPDCSLGLRAANLRRPLLQGHCNDTTRVNPLSTGCRGDDLGCPRGFRAYEPGPATSPPPRRAANGRRRTTRAAPRHAGVRRGPEQGRPADESRLAGGRWRAFHPTAAWRIDASGRLNGSVTPDSPLSGDFPLAHGRSPVGSSGP